MERNGGRIPGGMLQQALEHSARRVLAFPPMPRKTASWMGHPGSWVGWSADRGLCRQGFLFFEGAAAHGLSFPVGERAPDPLHGTELEVAEPDGAEDEIACPDAGDHGVELIVLKLAVETEAEAIEQNGCS